MLVDLQIGEEIDIAVRSSSFISANTIRGHLSDHLPS